MLGRLPLSTVRLDPVTAHNEALYQLDHEPAVATDKLHQLLLNHQHHHSQLPAETFENLLLIYAKYEVPEEILRSIELHMTE